MVVVVENKGTIERIFLSFIFFWQNLCSYVISVIRQRSQLHTADPILQLQCRIGSLNQIATMLESRKDNCFNFPIIFFTSTGSVFTFIFFCTDKAACNSVVHVQRPKRFCSILFYFN